jgi:hypothetical protein
MQPPPQLTPTHGPGGNGAATPTPHRMQVQQGQMQTPTNRGMFQQVMGSGPGQAQAQMQGAVQSGLYAARYSNVGAWGRGAVLMRRSMSWNPWSGGSRS